MSEFENLEHEGEDYARQHPEQVKEGEDAVEKKLGFGQQDDSQQGQDGGQQNNAQQGDGQQDDSQQDDSQQDDSQQDSSQQDGAGDGQY